MNSNKVSVREPYRLSEDEVPLLSKNSSKLFVRTPSKSGKTGPDELKDSLVQDKIDESELQMI